MIARALAAALALLTAAAWAQAPGNPQTVYRCGPDGRQYSMTPCAGGTALNADDARSAEQQRQAEQALARDRKLAAQLAAERREREKAVPGGAANVGPSSAKASAPKGSAPKHGKPQKKKPKKPPRPTAS